MKERIVILGATNAQLPLIEKAKAMGYETHVFAWKTGDVGEYAAEYFYPISLLDSHAILDECKRIKPIAIISIASDLAAKVSNHLCSYFDFPSNSDLAISRATNKILFRELLKANDVLQPNYLIDDIDNVFFPCIVKPSDRANSRGVKLVNSKEELIKAVSIARDISFERKAIIEEYIDGDEYSCELISDNGFHTIIAYSRVYINKEFKPSRIVVNSKNEFGSSVDNLMKHVLDLVGITNGASHIEFIVKRNAIYIIEMSPSMASDFIGSDLIPIAKEFNYIEAVIKLCKGEKIQVPVCNKNGRASLFYLSDDTNIQLYNDYQHVIKKEKVSKDGNGKLSGYFIIEE